MVRYFYEYRLRMNRHSYLYIRHLSNIIVYIELDYYYCQLIYKKYDFTHLLKKLMSETDHIL